MLAFLLANAFTSNDFSSLGPVVGGGCTSPQDSLGKAILQAHLAQGLAAMHAHESTTQVVPTKMLLALVREGDTHVYGQNTTHGMLYRPIQKHEKPTKPRPKRP